MDRARTHIEEPRTDLERPLGDSGKIGSAGLTPREGQPLTAPAHHRATTFAYLKNTTHCTASEVSGKATDLIQAIIA